MSVVRFGANGSDVYVYYDIGGFINCCGCCMSENSFHAATEKDMIEHLRVHQKNGDCVPDYVFDELAEAAKEAP